MKVKVVFHIDLDNEAPLIMALNNMGSILLLMTAKPCGRKNTTYLINGLMQMAIPGISTDGLPAEWGAALHFLRLANPVKPSNIYTANGSIRRYSMRTVNIIGYIIASKVHKILIQKNILPMQ